MSEEKDNIHPVVRLLAARMESHPEEFGHKGNGGRWAEWLDALLQFVTEEERVMLRRPMMQNIHEEVLDELMNGPERRAEEERIRQEEHRRWMKAAQGTAGGVLGSVGIGNVAPSQGLTISTAGQEALRIRKPGLLDRVLDRLIK